MKLFIWDVIRAAILIAFLCGAIVILTGCAPMISLEDCNHEPECVAEALAREDRRAERKRKEELLHGERNACRYPSVWEARWEICRSTMRW